MIKVKTEYIIVKNEIKKVTTTIEKDSSSEIGELGIATYIKTIIDECSKTLNEKSNMNVIFDKIGKEK